MTTPSGTVAASAAEGAKHSWEDTGESSWERAVQEDADGNIVVTTQDSVVEAVRKRRKNLERQDYAQRNRRVVRDMIRYLYIVIDASRWTRTKDPMFPGGATRITVITKLLTEFVQEFFDQNPVSHLGLILVQQGEATQLQRLSGNSKQLKIALQSVAESCASEGPASGGEFSLQNGLEVAGRSLGHQPRHGSREIVVVTAALSTCDPGYILSQTLPRLEQANIRVSCIALTAELHICRKLADTTSGTMGVCLDQQYLKDWLMAQCTPPPTKPSLDSGCEMIVMGFPSRTSHDIAKLVHAGRQKTLLARTAFTCPQCQAPNSELPADCAVCGLKLVLAPHLARSFHHLFPVPTFTERVGQPPQIDPHVASSSSASQTLHKSLDAAVLLDSSDCDTCCYACVRPLVTKEGDLLRLECPECRNVFCVDCDAYIHHSLHNCPGCLSR